MTKQIPREFKQRGIKERLKSYKPILKQADNYNFV